MGHDNPTQTQTMMHGACRPILSDTRAPSSARRALLHTSTTQTLQGPTKVGVQGARLSHPSCKGLPKGKLELESSTVPWRPLHTRMPSTIEARQEADCTKRTGPRRQAPWPLYKTLKDKGMRAENKNGKGSRPMRAEERDLPYHTFPGADRWRAGSSPDDDDDEDDDEQRLSTFSSTPRIVSNMSCKPLSNSAAICRFASSPAAAVLFNSRK